MSEQVIPSPLPRRRGLRRWVLVLLGAMAMLAPLIPGQPAAADNSVYTEPGEHRVNGRDWRTWCEAYSTSVDRCWTEIKSGNQWKFNNLTYLPVPRAHWGNNPLANNARWTDEDGRQWRTECDTAWTGRNGCRSQLRQNGKWVFNNIVMFGAPTSAPDTDYRPAPSNPAPSNPAPSNPAPSNPNPGAGQWPNASSTGVPAGVSLSTYNGPMRITQANTVIRNAVVNGTLRIEAPGVQIINSRINGSVDLRSPRSNNYSFSIVDSEVHIGDNLNTGLMRGNFEANRVEITGGRRSVYCEYNCVIENSWVHSQGGDPGGNAHFGGIRMGENTTVRGNTITCEAQRGSGTGCSAGLTGYGDFGPVQNNLIVGNRFSGGGGGGSTMCAYGGSSGDDGSKPYGHLANNVRFIDNVFERGASGKCGNLGSIRSFDPTRPGNVWQGNTWDDGSPISHNGR